MKEVQLKLFIIANENGVPILKFKMDDDIEESLFSGFFSAIHSFGSSSINEQLLKISMEGLNARIEAFMHEYKSIKLTVFGVISNEITSDKFKKFVDVFLEDFCHNYYKQLEFSQVSVDSSIFEPYEAQMKKAILENFIEDTLVFEDAYENKLDKIFERILKGDLSSLDDIE